jgi:Protein of unknown function (DUF1460)
MQILTPIYFDKDLIKNILSSTGTGWTPIYKTTTIEDKTKEKKIKLGGGLGVEIGFNELLQFIGKAKASGDLQGDFDVKDFLKYAVETSSEKENTEFGAFYQELPKLRDNKAITKINFDNRKNFKSGDFVEFECKFLKNSLKDTLEFLSEAINIYSEGLDDYLVSKINYEGIDSKMDQQQITSEIMIRSLKEKESYLKQNQSKNLKWIPITKKIIDQILPLLEKNDLLELRAEIQGLGIIKTVILVEKKFILGSINKFYGNNFTVIGKVIKHETKGNYSALESTIFSQLDDNLIDKLEEGLSKFKDVLKPFKADSQIESSKSNIRVSDVEILKILPIAIYT